MCGSEALCIVESPSRTAERGEGGWQSRDTHEHSTPALRHAWNHHGHARNTIRLHGGGCWSAGLQSWGSVSQLSTTKAQSRARPNRHHGQRQKKESGLFHSLPLTPPLSGWWAKAQSHRHTLFPFGLDLSSIVFCLWSFRSPGIPRAYWGM